VGGRRPRGGARLVGALTGLAAMAAACSSPASSAPPATAGRTTSSTRATGQGITAPTVDPGHVVAPVVGSSTTVPREVPARPINPVVDAGQEIVITPHGFEPAQLYATDTEPVVWTNLSGAPQKITFLALPVRSGVIPVGGQFVWDADGAGLTVAYSSASGFRAVLRLQPG
jgi:hypothetical protein